MTRCGGSGLLLAAALLLLGCGGTSRNRTPEPDECAPDDCTDACQAGCPAPCAGDECMQSCTSGERRCLGNGLYRCREGGSGFDIVEDCGAALVCDTELLRCIEELECPEGDCTVTQQCTPGVTMCQDNDVYTCSADGSENQLIQTCGEGRHCQVSPGGKVTCTVDVCVPGALSCVGNQVVACTELGRIPETGKDCGADVCVDGKCEPAICEPEELKCENDDLYSCFNRVAFAIYDECTKFGLRCGALGETLVCRAPACEPGKAACVGNARGTCAPDGKSLSNVVEDCAATGDVCTQNLTCGASALDAFGTPENTDQIEGHFAGNIIDVYSNRVVTKVEQHFAFEAPRDLRWVIYEAQGTEVAFMAPTYTLRASNVTSHAIGDGFVASGAFDYTLQAGKRYLIGAGPVELDAFAYFDQQPWQGTLSFGTIAGGGSAFDEAQTFGELHTANIYQQRITTELP